MKATAQTAPDSAGSTNFGSGPGEVAGAETSITRSTTRSSVLDCGNRAIINPPRTAPPTHGSTRNPTDFQQIGLRLRVDDRVALEQTSAGTSSGEMAFVLAN